MALRDHRDPPLPKPTFWFGDPVYTKDAALWTGVIDGIARTPKGWLYTIRVTEDGWPQKLGITAQRYEDKIERYEREEEAA